MTLLDNLHYARIFKIRNSIVTIMQYDSTCIVETMLGNGCKINLKSPSHVVLLTDFYKISKMVNFLLLLLLPDRSYSYSITPLVNMLMQKKTFTMIITYMYALFSYSLTFLYGGHCSLIWFSFKLRLPAQHNNVPKNDLGVCVPTA